MHLLALTAVLHEDFTKDLVNRKKFFIQNSLNLLAFGVDDVAAPHSDDFPLPKVFEEVLRADLSVEMPIVVPFLKRDKLDRLIVDVRREALL